MYVAMETALEGSAMMFRESCRPSMKVTKSLLDIPPPFSFFSKSVGLERKKYTQSQTCTLNSTRKKPASTRKLSGLVGRHGGGEVRFWLANVCGQESINGPITDIYIEPFDLTLGLEMSDIRLLCGAQSLPLLGRKTLNQSYTINWGGGGGQR